MYFKCVNKDIILLLLDQTNYFFSMCQTPIVFPLVFWVIFMAYRVNKNQRLNANV